MAIITWHNYLTFYKDRILTHCKSGLMCFKSCVSGGEVMCVFTAVFDIAENMFVAIQAAIEDEQHGELREDKTQLMRKKGRR